MTGTVTSIEAPGTCCHITGLTGMVYFAHQSDFDKPTLMVVGMDVEFRPKLHKPAKVQFWPVTDVVALQKQAA